MYKYDIAVIGGGAAGLAAAISAKKTNPSLLVAIIESNARVGKKLLTTGNGRCNITNTSGLDGRYHGDTQFAKSVFDRFGVDDAITFFKSIGIDCIELEEGKMYPMSLQAGSVVDQLRFACDELGVDTLCEQKVKSVIKKNDIFEIATDKTTATAKKVIICTGGKAAPKSGSNGDGYAILSSFGHKMVDTHPAIVQVTAKTDKIKALTGIKVEGTVTVVDNGKKISEKGEILFTDYGISGPPVLQISRIIAKNKGSNISLDLCPDLTFDEICDIIAYRINIMQSRTAEHLLVGFLNKRVGEVVIKQSEIALSTPINQLGIKHVKAIASKIKKFPIDATGTKNFDMAQVTAGGISCEKFDADTMQSRITKGLYAAGEVLNVDGDCGGFNLQWAWSSGIVAGNSAGK